MKKIFFAIFFFSAQVTFACRPAANYIAPTLAQNVKAANIIFKGKVVSVKELGQSDKPFGTKYQFEFQVEKTLKGSSDKTISLFSYSNTCDRLGYSAVPGTECLIFADKNSTIISGFLNGDASVCENTQLIEQRMKGLGRSL